jgi:hypothetical protein
VGEAEKPRRALFVDPTGRGMRVTWHRDRSLFVLSVWRDDVCIEAIRLDPTEAARLAGFVGHALAGAVDRDAGAGAGASDAGHASAG